MKNARFVCERHRVYERMPVRFVYYKSGSSIGYFTVGAAKAVDECATSWGQIHEDAIRLYGTARAA